MKGREYYARDSRNASTKRRTEIGHVPILIAMHAPIFDYTPDSSDVTGKAILRGRRGPYASIALTIKRLGVQFGKPVLLIHGDWHEFIVDRPFLVSKGEEELPVAANITRLQVYGAPEIRAVRVDVDTDTPWVFAFSPFYNE